MHRHHSRLLSLARVIALAATALLLWTPSTAEAQEKAARTRGERQRRNVRIIRPGTQQLQRGEQQPGAVPGAGLLTRGKRQASEIRASPERGAWQARATDQRLREFGPDVCGAGSGSCTSENGTPGCEIEACCNIICAADPFCCDVEWDQVCADAAAGVLECQGEPNACCDSGAPGGDCFNVDDCAECVGDNLECFEGMPCSDPAVVCAEVSGACCELDPASGAVLGCTDNLPASRCSLDSRFYDSGFLGTPLPDGDPAGISVVINVPDQGTISDLNVGLTVTHTWVGDLCASLTAPGGAPTVEIIQRPGAGDGSGTCHLGAPFGCAEDNYAGIVLDDQGTGGNIEDACAADLSSRPNYVPFDPLSVFNGVEKQGDWTLSISDNTGADTGTLDSWSLTITNAEDVIDLVFTPGAACAEVCPEETCGNGFIDPGEDCDPNFGDSPCCDELTCLFARDDLLCRASQGACDPPETCSGESADCPADAFSPPGEVCRPSTGPCDPAEACSGSDPQCPADEIITACMNGDGCCPSLLDCNNNTDDDCPAVCGNGVVEPDDPTNPEQCDPSDGVSCDGVCQNIFEPVPTVTPWGLLVMILLLLAAIGAKFGRRRGARVHGAERPWSR